MSWRCGQPSCLSEHRSAVPALRKGSSCRAGFTLFEVLLVLGILLALACTVTPALMRRLKEDRLRQGENGVIAVMRGARVHALHSGIPYQFRFENGGSRYIALPFDADALRPVVDATGQATAPMCWKNAGTLPKSVNFVSSSMIGAPTQGVPSDWLYGLDDAQALSQASWSEPIVYQPDGTTSGGVIEITNKTTTRWLIVRQLTGEVQSVLAGDTAALAGLGVTP